MKLQTISPRWTDTCVVAASGPSLTPEVAEACRGYPTLAIGDACYLLPWAEAMYHCDSRWWKVHDGCPDFAGEKWSGDADGEKSEVAALYGLNIVHGQSAEGFSLDPSFIHWGGNSGFQAINLAILWGGRPVVLVGFDMRRVNGQGHFFGEHPQGLINRDYTHFAPAFQLAAKLLPDDIKIVNATPGSALNCFPTARLDDALTAAA